MSVEIRRAVSVRWAPFVSASAGRCGFVAGRAEVREGSGGTALRLEARPGAGGAAP